MVNFQSDKLPAPKVLCDLAWVFLRGGNPQSSAQGRAMGLYFLSHPFIHIIQDGIFMRHAEIESMDDFRRHVLPQCMDVFGRSQGGFAIQKGKDISPKMGGMVRMYMDVI